MEHKFLRNFDQHGVWCKATREITVNGEKHDLDEYAKAHGISLPDSKKSKKHINTDIQEESHADMGEALQSGDTE